MNSFNLLRKSSIALLSTAFLITGCESSFEQTVTKPEDLPPSANVFSSSSSSSSSSKAEEYFIIKKLQIISDEERTLEQSTILSLKANIGPDVKSVDIWDTCSKKTQTIKNFYPGLLLYKIDLAAGNLCRGYNEYVINIFNVKDETPETIQKKINLISYVGIRNPEDLATIESLKKLEIKLPLPEEDIRTYTLVPFQAANINCTSANPVEAKDPLIKISENLWARISLSIDNENQKRTYNIEWQQNNPNDFVTLTPYIGKIDCNEMKEFNIYIADKIFVIERSTIDRSSVFSIFHNNSWLDLKDLLLKATPYPFSELQNLSLKFGRQNFVLTETKDSLNERTNDLFPSLRPEFIFSQENLDLKGIYWHIR